MKKLFTFFIVLTTFLFSSYQSKAQSLDSAGINQYCSVDTAIMFYSFSASNIVPGTTATVYYGDGSSTVYSPLTSGQKWGSHKYATNGIYTAKIMLRVGSTDVDSEVVTIRAYCSHVSFSIYRDNNSNCVKNTSEPLMTAFPAKIEITENSIIIDTIVAYGIANFRVQASTPYVFKLLNTPLGTSATCPSTGQYSFTTPASISNTPFAFGIQCGTTSQYDLMATVTGNFRPVSWSRIIVNAANLQSCGSQSGVLTLNISPKYTYSTAAVTPTSISGNTVTWNLTGLNSLYVQTIVVYVTPTTTVSLGDTICNSVSITPTSGDVNTANNTDSRCNTVVSSFDPNAKTVKPEGYFFPGDWFTYRIDFENLGNDTAFNIHILDTLSTHLNENSLEIINSTHAMTHKLVKSGTLNILKFEFPDIMLPDSNSKLYNKGYVEFRIRTKIGIAPNTTIYNKAGIYFDINPVVMTNATENTYYFTGIKQTQKDGDVSVYPNPANDVLHVNTASNNYIEADILNTLGQILISQPIQSGNNTIDMKQLSPGIYQLLLKGNNGVKAIKIEKL